MNERIKELLEDATEVYDDRVTGKAHRAVDYKIFAELIVRECIANCDDLNSMKYIANHFGIKVEGLE